MSSDSKPLPSIESIEALVVSKFKKISGSDSDGNEFKSMTALYDHMFNVKATTKKRKTRSDKGKDAEAANKEEVKNDEWYNKAFDYWESAANCPITDGIYFFAPILSSYSMFSCFRWSIGWLWAIDTYGYAGF